MKKYWLNLSGDTFLWVKKNKGLIYNTENGKTILFDNAPEIHAITSKLNIIDNLYCIEIDESHLKNKIINDWIQSVISINAGQLTICENLKPKPVQYYPQLNLQFQEGRKYQNQDHSIYQNYNTYLQEVTIHINGDETGNELYSKQTNYPQLSKSYIPFKELRTFLSQFDQLYISILNICGNPFSYNDWESLSTSIGLLPLKTFIHVKLETLFHNIDKLYILKSDRFVVKILVDSYNNEKEIILVCEALNNISINYSICYIIKSFEEYQFADNMQIDENKKIIPIYTGNNEDFFEKYVYIDQDDLRSTKLTKREIFAHQAMNTFRFGKFTIYLDKLVYTNRNSKAIGTIKNSVSELINYEMKRGNSWLKIRNYESCKECLYQWICPSPSDYESVLQKDNLCKISHND